MKCCYAECPNEAEESGVCCKDHKYHYNGSRDNRRALTIREIQEKLKHMKAKEVV